MHLLASALIALQFACASMNSRAPNDGDSATTQLNERFIIAKPGDLIMVQFDNSIRDTDWKQVVQDDGSIALPLKKSIIAAGKTMAQLEEEIRGLYVPSVLRRLDLTVRVRQATGP
jgi:protein involved in polysaccharide export with SLBB domain